MLSSSSDESRWLRRRVFAKRKVLRRIRYMLRDKCHCPRIVHGRTRQFVEWEQSCTTVLLAPRATLNSRHLRALPAKCLSVHDRNGDFSNPRRISTRLVIKLSKRRVLPDKPFHASGRWTFAALRTTASAIIFPCQATSFVDLLPHRFHCQQ